LHNNFQNITTEFFKEIANHKLAESDLFNVNGVLPCYGISRNPQTNDLFIVFEYMKGGDLRKYLNDNQLIFTGKHNLLMRITIGLIQIHSRGLVHGDFHPGNILNDDKHLYIADLGLCRPVNEKGDSNVYGVLPYVAPEILRGDPHTQASDIYSFGIVAYE
jgi:serine/threonine protein kinase